MTIEYKGKNLEEGRRNPEAWIFYDETKKAESEKADKLIEILESKGWKCVSEEGWIIVHVDFGRDEYDDLVWDYKEAKKAVRIR